MANSVLVIAEHLKGEITEITYEMLGVGRSLADTMKAPLTVLLMGDGTASLAKQLGMADTVFLLENPGLNLPVPSLAAEAIQAVVDQKQAGLVLVGGTNVSLGIGAALAARTRLPFVNFCKAVKADGGGICFTSQLFGGKILADVCLPDNRGIVSIYPGSFQAAAGKRDATPPTEKIEVAVGTPPVAFKRFIEPETGDVDITKQDALVAVGRGIQTQDNLALADDLAQALNGAVCASRPVIDQGWLPLSRQVGKSGMTVKPRLYLALGISGAPEHWEGMQGSQLIIAVNTDPKAPIFDGAHYGVCGDALELAPLLTEKIKAQKK
jgi:electron transfer flavoprotein alpha subunit